MKGYAVVTIEVLFQALGEERFNSLLSDFSCPNNQDVLAFFQLHALQASRVGFSQTHVVLAGYQGKPVIAGYYTLTQKALVIKERANLSKSLKYCDVIVKRYIEQAGGADGVTVQRDGLTYKYSEVEVQHE